MKLDVAVPGDRPLIYVDFNSQAVSDRPGFIENWACTWVAGGDGVPVDGLKVLAYTNDNNLDGERNDIMIEAVIRTPPGREWVVEYEEDSHLYASDRLGHPGSVWETLGLATPSSGHSW